MGPEAAVHYTAYLLLARCASRGLFRGFGDEISSAEPFETIHPLQQRFLEASL